MISFKCASCSTLNKISGDLEVGDDVKFKCIGCEKLNTVTIYPEVIVEKKEINKAEKIMNDEDASCYLHANNQAETICEQCGSYICNICAIKMNSKIICPNCLNSKTEDQVDTFQKSAILHNNIAFNLALLQLLFWQLAAFIAPFVFIYSLCCWNKVKTPYKVTKAKFIFAIMISSLGIVALGMIFFSLKRIS
ncbi:hypothetical protein AAEX28_01285 [Lentisphaerota bacterium WC36G]|nr:hypothetical protein LJT99_04170 [Lentisphaerae bacterium WC36]